MTLDELHDLGGAIVADGFDDALIGVAHRADGQTIAVYDYDRCVDVLVERDGMDYEGAVEFMEFNVVGAYVGTGTPLFVHVAERP